MPPAGLEHHLLADDSAPGHRYPDADPALHGAQGGPGGPAAASLVRRDAGPVQVAGVMGAAPHGQRRGSLEK